MKARATSMVPVGGTLPHVHHTTPSGNMVRNRMLQAIASQPNGAYRYRVANEIGITPEQAQFHTRRLRSLGLVTATRDPKHVRGAIVLQLTARGITHLNRQGLLHARPINHSRQRRPIPTHTTQEHPEVAPTSEWGRRIIRQHLGTPDRTPRRNRA